MEISHTFRLCLVNCTLCLFVGLLSARNSPVPSTLEGVPTDSILVLSLETRQLLSKSGVLTNAKWKPLLERFDGGGSPLQQWLSGSEKSGIDWAQPVQFFVRLSDGEHPHPQFGAIAKASSPNQADQTLSKLAHFLGLRPSKANPKIFQRATQPFTIGRQGSFCFLLGSLPLESSPAGPPPENEVKSFLSFLSRGTKSEAVPSALSKHASQVSSSDIALYIEGTGSGRLVETWEDNPLVQAILPLFDPFLQDSFGLFLNSQPGNLHIRVKNYSDSQSPNPGKPKPLEMIDQLPGDAPIVARLSIPQQEFQNFLSNGVDTVLRFLSANKLGADTDLPGFDLTARELLQFPSGDFAIAGGHSQKRLILLPNGQSIKQTHSTWAIGSKVSHPLALRELIAGMNAGMGLNSILQAHQLKMHQSDESLWLSTPEYHREIKLKKPIQALSFNRRKLLNNHNFALDFNPIATAKSLREDNDLNFDQLKQISWLDEFENVAVRLDNTGTIHGDLKLTQANKQGWELFAERTAQEWIDQINARLFLAIAQDDLNEVVEAVTLGALINANDRFGHSPLHYAAYKGNAYIVDYLLRHGGDPNTRGNHLSTPLHSAAWGKNQDVVELLLEDGAEVDARTDELETPLMTATLRGQLQTVETLLALSADPHAVDAYGSNLMDLAGASGNIELVNLLKEVGVKVSHPLHLAAGTGDFQSIDSLLTDGHSINEQDTFGATPLLVATVAGREDMVDYLLKNSADPKVEAKDGYSLLHGAAFSGKKSLVRKMLAFGLDLNQRYGPDRITPVDVGEEGSEGLLYLRTMGGRSGWELGPESQ